MKVRLGLGLAAILGFLLVGCDDDEVVGGAGPAQGGQAGSPSAGPGGAAGSNTAGSAGSSAGSAGQDGGGYVPPPPSGTSFSLRETIRQLYVWKAKPGVEARLADGQGKVIATATTDKQGSIVFRELTPGDGYTITIAGETTRALRVIGPSTERSGMERAGVSEWPRVGTMPKLGLCA